jgi:DNA-binding NarL/FixJ family response regulator
MRRVRVLLADDHTLVRAGLRSLLEGMPAVEVVGEAADGHEALKLVDTVQPNVVLMDVAMPNLNGLEATATVVKSNPNVRVIVLSMYSNEEYVLRALQAGASGYMLKSAATAELEMAIRAVASGKTFLSPAISKTVIDQYVGRTEGRALPRDNLTSRHRQILQLIAEGKMNKQIAFLLNLSVKTVEVHRAELMNRLGIRDVPGLVRYAMRSGLIPPEP